MPSGALAKRLLLAAGLGLLALMVVGFVIGAIGSAMFGDGVSQEELNACILDARNKNIEDPEAHCREELEKDGYISKPKIHLPPQPLFFADRDEHLGLTAAKGERAHAKPLAITDFAITNTLLSAWFATIVIILFFVLGIRKRSLVPGRFQGLVETLIEGAFTSCNNVLGPEMGRKAMPVIATIFFFVLFNAWLALLPFYQFLGFVLDGEIMAHLLRSAGTDLNMPLALALISFVFVEYWGFRARGFGYLKKFFPLGNLLRLRATGLIDVFVGFLELISELVRVVSFTFRLFGNMTAGEILVVMITFLVPFVATQFVFGLELLVGLIQAVIFAGLTLVFLSVAIRHQEH